MALHPKQLNVSLSKIILLDATSFQQNASSSYQSRFIEGKIQSINQMLSEEKESTFHREPIGK